MAGKPESVQSQDKRYDKVGVKPISVKTALAASGIIALARILATFFPGNLAVLTVGKRSSTAYSLISEEGM
jgi:hypothetical protein